MYAPNDLLSSTILPVLSFVSRSCLLRAFSLVALLLGWFAFSPSARAVTPAPDGGYPVGNTAEGTNALFSRTTGNFNTAIGLEALFRDTSGNFNTALGFKALHENTTATSNTALGYQALFNNKTVNGIPGQNNTATGVNALFRNTTGEANTANGSGALFANTTADFNTAIGLNALHDNTTGTQNTAIGVNALISNLRGSFNTATGVNALFNNKSFPGVSGDRNTATGNSALFNNTIGDSNTAVGVGALNQNTDGFQNTAVGDSALSNNFRGVTNTALGFQAASGANTTGTTAIGAGTLLNLTSGLDNTALGKQAGSGVIGADNVICIGAFVSGEDVDDSCYIGNIFSRPSPGGAAVFVNGFGKLGTAASSSRFKEKIKPMERASEALFALKPVTFRYKKEVDPASQSQFGLVAEDVEAVNPDLVVRDKEGKAYSVRYDQVNAMLLNEFLKEHRTVEELRATIAQQGKAIKVLTAGLQKVSEQIELSQSKPQLVDNAQ